MLDKEQVNRAVQRLHQAEKSREQIRALSLDHPEITIEDAYAIQRQWVELKIAEGRTLKGHKIGLTSRAMQVSSQITEPDYGALLDDMFFNDGSDIPIDRFIVPRVEVELAFVLAAAARAELHAVRRVQRHRLRHSRAGDYRRAQPQRRSRDSAAAQGVRHHLRQRRQRRGGDGRAADRRMRWICAGSPRCCTATA